MARIKYDTSLIQAMALFESFTSSKLKDCLIDKDSTIIFVVEQHQAGRAIGRRGERLRKLRELLKRKIKIVEFDPEVTQFVRNLLYPLQVNDVRIDGDTIVIEGTGRANRGLLIGKGRQNLLQYEEIVRRHFPVSAIKVV